MKDNNNFMFKKTLLGFFSLFFVFAFATSISAKTISKTGSVKSATTTLKTTPTPSPTPVAVNSFELFWPMSAGKTIQSKVYFLKTLKEKVRGFFIFGSAQKADYDVFLGIKRMLEAESLMKGNAKDAANNTLDLGVSEFNKANDALTNAKNSSDIDKSTKDEINIRVTNLKTFTSYLMNQYPDYKEKLQTVLDKLNSLTV